MDKISQININTVIDSWTNNVLEIGDVPHQPGHLQKLL